AMQQVDGLQWTHHHLEVGNAAILVERDDVDAVEGDSLDHGLELEHGASLASPLAAINEAGAIQHLQSACEVLKCDVAAALRRVHDRALEHGVRVQQVPERGAVVGLHVGVPFVEAGHCHGASPHRAERAKSPTSGLINHMHIDAYAPLCIKSS